MEKILECTKCLEFIWGLISDIKFLLGIFLTLGIFYFFWFKKEIRLFNNLKKEIYFLKTEKQQNIDNEIDRLREDGLFKVHATPIDLSENIRNLVTKDRALLVLVYNKDYDTTKYEKILDYSSSKKMHLICYSKGKIEEEHDKMFKEHPYVDICNTPTRLLSMIFTISAVTPNEKK